MIPTYANSFSVTANGFQLHPLFASDPIPKRGRSRKGQAVSGLELLGTADSGVR